MNPSDRVLTITPEEVATYFQQSPHLQCMADDVIKTLRVNPHRVKADFTTPAPARWLELNAEQHAKVERYIDTLLAQQAPLFDLIEKPGREVMEQRSFGSVSYQLEKVKCGKGCKGCPHGPYWYGYYRGKKGKMTSEYIGKEFKRIDGLM